MVKLERKAGFTEVSEGKEKKVCFEMKSFDVIYLSDT